MILLATVKTKPSVFYAIRTVAGRELDVALMMENRAKSIKQHLDVRSIIVPPEIRIRHYRGFRSPCSIPPH